MAWKPSTALFVGVVIGLLVGSGVLVGALPVQQAGNEDPYDDPGYSLTRSIDCYEGPTPNAGWVHEVANGDHYGVTLNATIVHDPDREVSVDVSERAPGAYEIAILTAAPATDGGERMQRRLSACERAATDVGLATGLPTDYERAVVTVNSRELLSFENVDTAADLYQLPNPVNATATKA
jgi:hypothetical protein